MGAIWLGIAVTENRPLRLERVLQKCIILKTGCLDGEALA